MKRILVLTLVGVGILLAGTYISTETIIEKSAPEIIERETVVSELEKRISDAQNANLSDVEAKAQSAYDEAYNQAMKEIELEVTKLYREEIEVRETELEKDVGVHWRNPENVIRLIKQTFPEDPHSAVAIARCESGLKPNAHNPNNPNGTTDGGLWQINDVHNETLEALGLDKYDPVDATKFARMLYEKNGWRDWVCYTHNLIAMAN